MINRSNFFQYDCEKRTYKIKIVAKTLKKGLISRYNTKQFLIILATTLESWCSIRNFNMVSDQSWFKSHQMLIAYFKKK